jgi:hypothetical protein
MRYRILAANSSQIPVISGPCKFARPNSLGKIDPPEPHFGDLSAEGRAFESGDLQFPLGIEE